MIRFILNWLLREEEAEEEAEADSPVSNPAT